ncbi:unnamed protein product [Fusarium graminearum]|nr:hypothetical protein HG531_003125 [Fusarium graminearum]CAF3507613.1 unnamed protein product [Fusarium graminearum]CAG1962174.1 unnamed protein product [Fusarium graminearum]VTO86112.1 unnamed protein product [Fusarium graminearum]
MYLMGSYPDLAYLHHCTPLSQGQGNTLLILKGNSPDSFTLSDEFSNEMSGLEIPYLNSAITATTHDSSIIKLQTCDAIIMGCKTVNRAHLLQRPNSD